MVSTMHNIPALTHEDIVQQCLAFDAIPDKKVYLLSTCKHTCKLGWMCLLWVTLAQNERYALVQSRNIFESKEAVEAAIARALAP